MTLEQEQQLIQILLEINYLERKLDDTRKTFKSLAGQSGVDKFKVRIEKVEEEKKCLE